MKRFSSLWLSVRPSVPGLRMATPSPPGRHSRKVSNGRAFATSDVSRLSITSGGGDGGGEASRGAE
eukprot:1377608-Prymnesium_polylepis.1